jgi:hypothetical protein
MLSRSMLSRDTLTTASPLDDQPIHSVNGEPRPEPVPRRDSAER